MTRTQSTVRGARSLLERFPPIAYSFPLMSTPSHAYTDTNPENPLAPLHHRVLGLLSPRGNPDGLADRAGDTLSGKTGRRTKEGEPGRCVATSSDFGLRLPSAPRTNPMNVPAVVAYLGDCRSATAAALSTR